MTRRQVRFSYPEEYVRLALVLARNRGSRGASQALKLPLSTLYRWLDRYHDLLAEQSDVDEQLDALISACESLGFDVRHRIQFSSATASSFSQTRINLTKIGIEEVRRGFTAEETITPIVMELDVGRSIALSPTLEERLGTSRAEIEAHYYSRLTCASLARTAAMSRFHFIRMFRLAFGMSPYRYLMRTRVRHAKRLLDTTRQSLEAIATAVGYESQSSLCRAFRRIENLSLSEYFSRRRLGSQYTARSIAGYGQSSTSKQRTQVAQGFVPTDLAY